MNEFTDILDNQVDDEVLAHYGTPRHSGRYPWGSGKNPQRNKNLLTRIQELKDQGLSFDHIICAEGSGGTMAGVALGVFLFKDE